MIPLGDTMKEITRLFVIDSHAQERLDALYLDGKKLSFRSKNSGDIVLSTYNSYYCEAAYELDEANSEKFVASLDATWDNLDQVVSKRFVNPAGLDQLKRHCDQNEITYQFQFIVD